MHGAQREHQCADRVKAGRLGGADGRLQVIEIEECVKAGHATQSVGGEAPDPELDDVVGDQVEADQALAAHPAVERRAPDPRRHEADTLPRVLAEVAHTDVERHRGHQVDGVEPHGIHALGDRQHHRGRHARRPQRLMGVAQGHVDDTDLMRPRDAPRLVGHGGRIGFPGGAGHHAEPISSPSRLRSAMNPGCA